MKLLVFAASDSDGIHLSDASRSWPELVRAAINERHGIDLEITYRRLYVHTVDWDDYFESALSATKPDIIIVCVNGVSWAFRTVPIRLRKWFGRRAGRWSEQQQRRMDSGAKSHRPLAPVANGVHWVVRHTVPRGSFMSRTAAEQRWLAVIDRVAREEDAFGVIASKVNMRGELLKAWPKVNEEIAKHNAVLKRRTEEKHLAWFDREDVLRTLGDDAAYLEDKLHRQESFHVLMAQRMIETLSPVFAQSRV